MAAFLPVVLIGAPVGYFTWKTVYDTVEAQVGRICHQEPASSDVTQAQRLQHYPPRSNWAAAGGATVSLVLLSKTAFSAETRHRLFFAKAPPNANIRITTAKLGLELLARCAVVFYGTAAGGAAAGRLVVCGQ